MMRPIYMLLLALIMSPEFTLAQVNTEKVRAISDFIEDQLLNEDYLGASLSFKLIDLNSGNQVVGYDPGRSLSTASTLKLFSTAAALEEFGPSHQFETKLALTGEIDSEGTLLGDVFILGGGDPCFGSADFKEDYGDFLATWRDALISQGIKKINGSVLADASFFETESLPRAWSWGDIGNYYGSGVYGLNVYDNTYNLYFDCPSELGSPTNIQKVEPHIPGLIICNEVCSAIKGGDNAYIFGAPDTYVRTIRGTLPAGKTNFKIKGSIPNPPFLLAYQLDSILRDAQIEITGEPKRAICEAKNYVISKILSPDLAAIVKATNEKSVNLYAEALRMQIEKRLQCDPQSSPKACLSEFWEAKGISDASLFLEDGSGLSRTNSASASDLCQLLFYMHSESEHVESFKESLAISGQEGTLKYFGKTQGLSNRFVGKSGSMNRVRSYAGYLETKSGKPYALAIILNNYASTSSEVRKLIEEIIVKCAAL